MSGVGDDDQTQQFHGGQEWKFIKNFTQDFSVTTNGLGTPSLAMQAAIQALSTVVHHYPPADQEPALSSLSHFLSTATSTSTIIDKKRVLLGNGASELIDLVVRVAASGPWAPGPSRVQYKEYKRSAESHGREILPRAKSMVATLVSVVNPTNPTGDYMRVDEMKQWILSNVQQGATVTVDESMQPWVGPHWLDDSLVSQTLWIQDLFKTSQISVYVIHSWTKIWSCTGLRLGSIVCPTTTHAESLRRMQVPWSVNSPALAFLDAVVQDKAYLEETWKLTPEWNKYARTQLEQFKWNVMGHEYLSWLWIDMGDAGIAENAVQLAREAGVPVRWGKPGYELPTHVRIAVRPTHLTDVLINAWGSLVQK